MNQYVFMSYRSIEKDFALKLASDLLQVGYPVWMDRLHGILPGDEWRQSLEQGITKASAVLACMSRNYIESTWCRRELQRADTLKKPIFPVLIGPVSNDVWPMEIQDKHYADFQSWTDDIAYQKAFGLLLAGIERKFGMKPGKPVTIPTTGSSDPARNDPEDLGERGIECAAQIEQSGGFAAIEAEELRKDMEVWLQMFKAAAQQYRIIIDESLRIKLQLQMDMYKAKYTEIDTKIRAL